MCVMFVLPMFVLVIMLVLVIVLVLLRVFFILMIVFVLLRMFFIRMLILLLLLLQPSFCGSSDTGVQGYSSANRWGRMKREHVQKSV